MPEMLNAIERRNEIVLLTEQTGKVDVRVLSDQFNVSVVTIRGDLDKLDSEGLIIRSRGGAMASSRMIRGLSIRPNHHKKGPKNRKMNQLLAVKAAQLINSGDSVIINSGTITEEITCYLADKSDLFVMTNGLHIANELAMSPSCEVYLTGGKLEQESMSFCDPNIEKHFTHLNFNKIFLGADSLDLNIGLTSKSESDAKLNRIMCNNADQIIIVADSSKLAKRSLHSVIGFEKIDVLVTDNNIPQDFASPLIDMNIHLHIVGIDDIEEPEKTSIQDKPKQNSDIELMATA